MPPPLARLRRTLGRSLAVGYDGSRPRGEGGGTQHALPLTVRGPTADGADVRLLVEAMVAAGPAAPADPVRVTRALLLAAARRWLAAHDLPDLPEGLPHARDALEHAVGEVFDDLDLRLLRLDVVSVEHLLASPSGADGTGVPR
ncbi:hypothetical protein BJ993_001319 [Nocardioides aromaticivorans]|uniref:Uncharacterized protein n=1 Tax=Nocardioides aromaticivorans TaxID=200618 RepID=A0A7Y9ZF22_9ACTN|nr:hypothetical protein [Nocardioides aromaticivorans]NYI44239.1 hypothetical protein [Nocardioides aromaticivorans]